MKKASVVTAVLALLCVGVTANAGVLLVDRGLPTANLNNAAGANRSNVAWAFAAYTSPITGWLAILSRTQARRLGQSAVFGCGRWAKPTLRFFGVELPDQLLASCRRMLLMRIQVRACTKAVQAMITMHQIDFAVNITLGAGQIYQFFLDGSGSASAGQDTSVPFVHASNAALSGSPQDGADNLMLYANVVGGVVDPDSIGTWSSSDPGRGWDKASDVNVRVYGQVPEPGTLILLGSGLLGLVAAGRKKFRKKIYKKLVIHLEARSSGDKG